MLFYECAVFPLGSSSSSIRPPPDHIILRIVDECIRWSVVVETIIKRPEDITVDIMSHWVKIYDKLEMLIWDVGRSMVSVEALQWASRNSVLFVQRVQHNNAWVVERRNETLRSARHQLLSNALRSSSNTRWPIIMHFYPPAKAYHTLFCSAVCRISAQR